MKTNIDIDDKLVKSAMKTLGVKTKKEAVEAGLRLVQQMQAADSLRKMRGKVDMFKDQNGTTIISK
jgi:Arc/MetJ family transcription regulator